MAMAVPQRKRYRTAHDEVAARFPEMTARATTGSKAAAIKLFCIECMGGERAEAARCESRTCWLWPHTYRQQRGAG